MGRVLTFRWVLLAVLIPGAGACGPTGQKSSLPRPDRSQDAKQKNQIKKGPPGTPSAPAPGTPADPNSPLGEGDGGADGSSLLSASEAAFERRVAPLVGEWCQACHEKHNAPFFASKVIKTAHQATAQTGVVNLKMPLASRLYLRLVEDEHNCPAADCMGAGSKLLEAIKTWARDIKADTPDPNLKITANLKLRDGTAPPAGGTQGVTMTYDIGALSGIPGTTFVITIRDLGDSNGYALTGPRIVLPMGSPARLKVKGIKPYVNDVFKSNHATFTSIDRVVTVQDGPTPLSTATLIAVKPKIATDHLFSFAFDELAVVP